LICTLVFLIEAIVLGISFCLFTNKFGPLVFLSFHFISSDGEWDSDFDDEGNDEEAVAAAVDTKQSPQDNGAYDPEPIEGTSEYAMKVQIISLSFYIRILSI